MSNRRLRMIRFGAPLIGGIVAFLLMFEAWPWASRTIWPASRYYDLVSVEIGDAEVGQPVPLRAVRQIKRDFAGRYNVSIREVGKSAPICNGGMAVRYRAGSDIVLDTDLEYWTAGAVPDCMSEMKPGMYILSTCIFIDIPPRETCRDSNVFTIRPRPTQ